LRGPAPPSGCVRAGGLWSGGPTRLRAAPLATSCLVSAEYRPRDCRVACRILLMRQIRRIVRQIGRTGPTELRPAGTGCCAAIRRLEPRHSKVQVRPPRCWRMSGAGREVLSTTVPHASLQRVGLIARQGRRPGIAGILTREGFAIALLDCVGTIADTDDSVTLAAVVLSIDGTVSTVGRLLESLSKRFEPVPLVVACASIQRREVRAALAAGAAGVVIDEDLDASLGACLRAVGAGQACVPREHWREIEPAVLSIREKQVLGLVASGYMNRQIAERLFIAESTVKSHLSSAFGKLGVRSRNEAAELISARDDALGVEMADFAGRSVETTPAERVAVTTA
jgi:DNA-binding NarL/FixJ family response regulator